MDDVQSDGDRRRHHEIRGALAVIAGHADILLESGLPDGARASVVEIGAAAERIARLLGASPETDEPGGLPSPDERDEQAGGSAPRCVVVLIEDDDLTREVVERMLTGLGAVVRSAPDGHRGLALVAEQRPDLVFLDLGLPDLDGRDVLQQLLADDVAVVVSTGEADATVERELQALGALAFIPKPAARRSLASALELALRPDDPARR